MGDGPLDQVNRFVIVVSALTVVCVALLVTLLAWAAPDETIGRISDFAGYLSRHNDRETKVIISLISAVVALLMLTVIIIEITPPPSRRMSVRSMTSGDAVITTSQIAARIDAEVTQIPHVARCAALVTPRGKKVEVVLDLDVDSGANLSLTADEACRRAHVLLEQQLGIEMAAMPRARLRYRELHLRREDGAPPEASVSTGWERPQTTEGDFDQRG